MALFLGVLGYGAYYMTKKTKKHAFRKQGENGIIQVKDGIYINQQTGAFLFEVDGRQVFTVFGQNGVQSIQLSSDKSFTNMLQQTLQEEMPKTEEAKENI